MGGITAVLPALLQTAGAVAGIAQSESSRRDQREKGRLAVQQLEAQQRLQEAQGAANAALQREQIALDTAQTEEERRAALKRAVARQRANFGAQGVGSGSGSSQAVLLGLFEESDAERERREAMDVLRLREVDEGLSQRKATNVLERAQAQERSRLGSLSSSLDGFGNAVNFGKVLFPLEREQAEDWRI